MPTGKNKKVIGLMKDEFGGKVMTESVAIRRRINSYVIDDGNSGRKAKETKNCVIKRILNFNDYKSLLLNNEFILKLQQRVKS